MLSKRTIEILEKEILGNEAPANKRPEITNPKLSKCISYFIIKENKNLHQLVEDMLIEFISLKDKSWEEYFANSDMQFSVNQVLHFYTDDNDNFTRPKEKKKTTDG